MKSKKATTHNIITKIIETNQKPYCAAKIFLLCVYIVCVCCIQQVHIYVYIYIYTYVLYISYNVRIVQTKYQLFVSLSLLFPLLLPQFPAHTAVIIKGFFCMSKTNIENRFNWWYTHRETQSYTYASHTIVYLDIPMSNIAKHMPLATKTSTSTR